jgi:hypothetical protein
LACTLVVFILLFTAVLVAPKVFDSDAVKSKIQSEIKKAAGAEIDFAHLILDFFPRPHVILNQVTLLVPATVKGQSVSLMVIQGQMQNGEISIPNIQFDLTDTAGEVVIARGILQGQNLKARLGNSTGQNGKLKLGLVGDVAPFHLETDLRADLSQLPPILKRLVDDQNFQRELDLLKELKGSARGKLILGEDTDNVKVDVAASNIQLTARYERLPYALKIINGKFSYNQNRIAVEKLSGKLAESSFSQLSGNLGLKNNHDLEIRSGQSGLHLAEIVPWLASFKKMREISEYYGGGKSIITLSHLKVKGPLLSPEKWDFNAHINLKHPLKSAAWGNLKGNEVKGTLDDMHIYPLAPSAIAYELKEMMRKTVERPIKLI